MGLIILIILAYHLYKKIMECWKVIEMNKFKEFIKDKVIPTFNEQRQGESDDRFAILLLASKASLWGLKNSHLNVCIQESSVAL